MMRHFIVFICLGNLLSTAGLAQSVHTSGEDKLPTGQAFRVSTHRNPATCVGGSCDGSAWIFAEGGMEPYTITWNDGYVGDSRTDLCAQSYWVSVLDATGVRVTHEFRIDYTEHCFWAGDTDNNQEVNHKDLLPIALAYGESGFDRPGGALPWLGQNAQDWNTVNPIPGLPNYKHIDCDGNGIINKNDLTGILANYGRHYNEPSEPDYNELLPGQVPVGARSITGYKGQRCGIPIWLGTPASLAQNVYGLAFTLRYDPAYVLLGSEMVDFSDSWLSPDPIDFYRIYPEEGKIEVALARKDRLNNTGFGNIGTLFLTIRDDVFRSEEEQPLPPMPISIEDIRLIDNQNRVFGTEALIGWLNIDSSTVSSLVEETASTPRPELLLYPNPATNQIVLELSAPQEVRLVQITDASGKVVFQTDDTAHKMLLSTEHLNAGLYCVSASTNTSVLTQKLQVVK